MFVVADKVQQMHHDQPVQQERREPVGREERGCTKDYPASGLNLAPVQASREPNLHSGKKKRKKKKRATQSIVLNLLTRSCQKTKYKRKRKAKPTSDPVVYIL